MWPTLTALWLALSGSVPQRPAPRRRPAFRRPAARPRLEALEDRCLLSAGALDPNFGNGAGYVTTSLTRNNDSGASVVIEPNGTLIESGLTSTSTTGKNGKVTTTYAVGLTAYNPDGSLDTAFGNGGQVIGPATSGYAAVNVVLYPTAGTANDGKFLVTGLRGFAFARYNANGTLDTSFGQGGIATANFGTTLGTEGTGSAVIEPNGQIVALGQSQDALTAELARFNANGSLDTSFGNSGLATAQVPYASTLLSQPDGSLVVVGYDQLQFPSPLVMAGFSGTGTLNKSFGSSGTGYVTNSSFNGGAGISGALGVLDPTGKTTDDQIVVIGTAASGGGWELTRYNPNGALDTSFGNGGMVNTKGLNLGVAVAVQPDGKIVAAGDASRSAVGLARYNTDGSLDSTFGTGGIVTTQIGARFVLNSPNNGGGVTLQPNGDIVVAGSSYDGSKWNFAVAHYLPSEPQIGSFTASPNPVTAGSSTTLTVSNITDGNPNSTITQVAFYLDSNGDGKLEVGTDTLLGYATQTSPGIWTYTFTVNLAPGTYTLFAQAEDSYGVFGDPLATTLQVL
jgi:uncharacterized delta-60 repeat protein